MKISDPVIKNDINNAILQAISNEKQIRWMLHYYNFIKYDGDNGVFTFDDYDFFWEQGVFIKNYIEYPLNSNFQSEDIVNFITEQISQEKYVVANLRENIFVNKVEYQNRFLFYDFDKVKMQFGCGGCDVAGNWNTFNISFKDICNWIMSSVVIKEHKFTFDLFKVNKNFNLDFRINQIYKDISN